MSAIAGAAVDSPMTNAQLDQLSINTIRTLSIDAVQQANSGHPGTPMALAPLVYTLWNRVMRFDPKDPIWPNRDRFVLSNGHASMLLWSVLYLTGTRAVNAEYERLGRAVGLARRHPPLPSARQQGARASRVPFGVGRRRPPPVRSARASPPASAWPSARRWLANRYNRPGFEIFDYNIYAVCGDGCLMEGVASEAASLAGHLGLDNLCWIYDNNHITIEGNTRIAFTEDVAARFLAYGWNVLRVGDANDIERIEQALEIFQQDQGPSDLHHSGQPYRLRLATQAGYRRGSWRAARRGGDPPHQARLRLAGGRQVPGAATACTSTSPPASARAAAQAHARWTELFAAYRSKYPELATEIDQMQRRELPAELGSATSRSFRPTPRASPDGMPRAKC